MQQTEQRCVWGGRNRQNKINRVCLLDDKQKLTLENGCLWAHEPFKSRDVSRTAVSGARSPRLSVQALFEHIHEGERFSLSLFFLNAIFGNTWNAETAALITGTNTRVMWERQVRDTWAAACARRQNGGRLETTPSSLCVSALAHSLLLFFFFSSSADRITPFC